MAILMCPTPDPRDLPQYCVEPAGEVVIEQRLSSVAIPARPSPLAGERLARKVSQEY